MLPMAYMLHWGGTAYIACNDVFGQEDNYAGDLEDQTGINGNISCDPMFCDPTPRHPYFGNYYLKDIPCCAVSACDFLGNHESIIGALGVGCPKRPIALPIGDFTDDGKTGVGDYIEYTDKTGLYPGPLAVGDANRDGVVDVGDVVYLINYLFKSGPPPTY
jgi:hypothetical protein